MFSKINKFTYIDNLTRIKLNKLPRAISIFTSTILALYLINNDKKV